MTDTDTYDVEFSDVDSNPGTPTTNPSNWFDPDTDTSKDFTQMLWRAERECVNGTWGSWTVVRIKGEKGDKGDKGDTTGVNPNILLRTIFDNGIDPVKQAWASNWSYTGIDGASDTVVQGRKSIRINATNAGTSVDFQQNVYGRIKASTWYTLSFNVFATAAWHFFIYNATNSTSVIDLSAGYIIDGEAVSTSAIDGKIVFASEWADTRHTITFKTRSSFSNTNAYILFRCLSGNQLAICMPKLEEGKVATAYVAHEDDLRGADGTPGTPGSPGSQGNRGPALRGPQDWNLCTEYGTVNYQFYKGAEGEPYIDIVTYNGYFYLCKKSYSDKTILPTNSTYWQLGDKVGLVAAAVMFAEHGYFGDAIISGSWLISANGTIDGTVYNKGSKYQNELAYNLFNADSPLGADIQKYYSEVTSTIGTSSATLNKATVSLQAGRVYYMQCAGYTSNTSHPLYVRLVKTDDSSVTITPINLNTTSSQARSGYARITQSGDYYIQLYHDTGYTGTLNMCKLVEKCFAPYYALNLKNGKVYQVDAYLNGGMRSPFTYLGRGNTFSEDFSDNVAVYSASQSTYALPWSTDQSGRKVTITNYYWNGSYSTASGYAEITAPTGKYFYEDGVTKSSIKLSREAVELLGYGDTSTFYGWIVLKRIDLGTQNRYGHPMKMLANGRVTGTTSGASIIYHTFDGTTLTVTRNSQGRYTITWNNANWFADSSHVFAIATGFGNISNGTNPVWAQVESQTTTSITIRTADDASLNDGSFNFFIMNFNDWIYL
jgi:hypothetical protein